MLFRSDTLQFLTDEDGDVLVGRAGLCTVIDLRLGYELRVEGCGPLEETAVFHHHLPFLVQGTTVKGSATPILNPDDPIVPHYLAYLSNSAESVVGVVHALAAPNALPAVVHCAAGKDRTGVAVAIVLSAVGVNDEEIAMEYAAGGERVAQVMERLRGMPSYGDSVDQLPPAANITPPDYMLRFLTEVRRVYGGVTEYLMSHGVTQDELRRLRDALTEPTEV
jgi:protein tyrosine/serine phosphatase